MKCIVDAANIKVLSGAISCLSKIGKEIDIEVDKEALILRAINDSKQAFVECSFFKSFFTSFLPPPDGTTVRCKLSIKAMASIFKSTRTAISLTIFFDEDVPGEVNIVFEFECKHGINKQHRFVHVDCEIYGAMFDSRDPSVSHIESHPEMLSRLVAHIHGTEEIVMSVSREEGMKIRSYFNQTEEVNLQQLQTEMVINASEFEKFDLAILSSPTVGNFYHLCFCVKEFKAILAFFESNQMKYANLSRVNMHFTEGGSPLMIASPGATSPPSLSPSGDEGNDSTGNQPFTIKLIIATARVSDIAATGDDLNETANHTNRVPAPPLSAVSSSSRGPQSMANTISDVYHNHNSSGGRCHKDKGNSDGNSDVAMAIGGTGTGTGGDDNRGNPALNVRATLDGCRETLPHKNGEGGEGHDRAGSAAVNNPHAAAPCASDFLGILRSIDSQVNLVATDVEINKKRKRSLFDEYGYDEDTEDADGEFVDASQ